MITGILVLVSAATAPASIASDPPPVIAAFRQIETPRHDSSERGDH
jgi:hypothetical protein